MDLRAFAKPSRRSVVAAGAGVVAALVITAGVWATTHEDPDTTDQTLAQPSAIAPDLTAHEMARADLGAKITATQELLAGVGDQVLDAAAKTALEAQVVAAQSLIDAPPPTSEATQADVDLSTAKLVEALAAFEPATATLQASHTAFLARAAEIDAAPAPKPSAAPRPSTTGAPAGGTPPAAPAPAAPPKSYPPRLGVNCLPFVGSEGSPPPPGVNAAYLISGDRSAPYTIVISVVGGGSQTLTVPAGVSLGSTKFPGVAYTGKEQCSIKPG